MTVKVYEEGALEVQGPTDEREWTIAVLLNAADALESARKPLAAVPAKDTDFGSTRPAALRDPRDEAAMMTTVDLVKKCAKLLPRELRDELLRRAERFSDERWKAVNEPSQPLIVVPQ